MVGIITGKGTGLERSSAFVLGSQGQLGSAALGRDGESVFVNAANGNLVVTRQDEFLIGLGPDVSIGRTYNSQSTISDGDNGDNWRASVYRKIQDLSGTYGAAATNVKRIDWDGSETLYTWNATYIDATHGAYVAADGAGAYDMLTRSGEIWTWTDGNSRITELYDQTRNGLITTATDSDGNSLTYTYNATSGLITRVTSLNGDGPDEYVDLTYNPSKQLTKLVTTKADGSLTRVVYTYDGSNRLATVTVDLSPNDSVVTDYKYVTTYTYHASSTRVASIGQSDGSLLEIAYVLEGGAYKVSSYTQTVAAGVTRTTSFDYSIPGRTTVTDPAGQKTVLSYDANGNLAAIAYPADPAAAARAVQFAYNANGDIVSAVHGPGNVVTYGYDSHGNAVTERDSAGNLVWRTYGARNELLTESRTLNWSPSVPTSSFETPEVGTGWAYNPTISGTSFTSTAGITGNGSAFGFAAATEGDQIAFVQSSPNTAGSISETIGGLKAGTRYIVTFAIAARPIYGGNPITVSFDGNALGTFMPSSTNFETIIVGFVATGSTGTLTFAGANMATDVTTAIDSVKVAEVQTSWYAYDGANHLRYALGGEGGLTKYGYDMQGRLTSTVEFAGHVYTESALRPGKPIVDTVLDAWVNGLADKSTNRRTETSYDFRGNVERVTSHAKLTSAGAFDNSSEKSETTHVYDQAGNLLSRVSNVSAAAETFVYDGLNRMTMATDFNANVTSTYFVDARGQTVVTHANGLSEVSTYNRGGELIGFSRSEAGANLIDLAGWPGDPGNLPSGYAIMPGWQNNPSTYDETRWQNTIGPGGLPVVAIQAGQLDASAEGGGNFTNDVIIDETKAYEFVYYFKLSALDKHNVYFGMSAWGATAWVENATTGADDINPYFYVAPWDTQSSTYTQDKWYKLVGYVLPEGSAAVPAGSLGGIYDVSTGQKVANADKIYRWNPDRPNDSVHARFFDYYREEYQQYSTYFYQPEIRQVTAPAPSPTLAGPASETSLYRYDNLGRLRMTVDPTGRRQHMMYDSAGRKIADIDADGSVIEYRYDGNDNLTSTTRYADKIAIGPLVDANGNPANVAFSTLRPNVNAAGNQWTFQIYDAAQRLVQTIDGTGATTVLTYDGASQLVSTKTYANRLSPADLAALRAAALNTNSWYQPNGLYWYNNNLTASTAGTINGADAYKFTVVAGGTYESSVGWIGTVAAGDVLSVSLSLKAVGSVTSNSLGLLGWSDLWGANAETVAVVESGPGTMVQLGGGLWKINGLQTGAATRITISRRFTQAETVEVYAMVGDTNFATTYAGDAMIVAAPVLARSATNPVFLPAADSAHDRASRTFYDKDGRVIAALDGAGGLTRFVYDKAGRKIGELGAAKAADSSLWATGTLAELVTSVGTSSADRRVDYVHDARGFLRFTLDASARPVEMVYDAAGRVIRTVSYAGSIASAATYSLPYVTAQLSATGLAANAGNRIARTVYDAAGRAMFGIDATGAVNSFAYDNVGNVIKQTAFATLYVTPGDPSLAAMQSWATANAAHSDNRVSRNVYDLMGRVAYSVDAENFVTEHRYDRAGRTIEDRRYAGVYPVADGVTKESLAAQIGAPSGAVSTIHAYDADGLLSESVDGVGAVTRFTYDAFGRAIDTILAYNSEDASTTRRAYDVLGRMVSETRGHGTAVAATTSFDYDSLGNLIKVTDPLGHDVTRTYDRLGRVLETVVRVDETAANDLKTTNEYNAFGEVAKVTDARGNAAFSWYNMLGQLVLQVDQGRYATATAYSTFGMVASVTRHALAIADNVTLTVTSPPTPATDAKDATTAFLYDKGDRLVSVTDAEGKIEDYQITAFGQRGRIENKADGVTDLVYDRLGRVSSEFVNVDVHDADGSVDAALFETYYTYDSRGNLLTRTEGRGLDEQRITSFAYDPANRLVATTHAAVQIVGADLATTSTVTPQESFSYNLRGQPIRSIDAAGGKTHLYYDALGRKTSEVNAVGTLSRWTYDASGNVASLKVYGEAVAIPTDLSRTPPPAPTVYRETLYQYDWANRLKRTSAGTLLTGEFAGSAYATETGEVAATTTFYNHGGVARETDGRGQSAWTWYDRLGREAARVDRDNYLTVWTRNADGNVLVETRYATRIAGSVSEANDVAGLQALAGTSAADRTTEFSYDRNGRRRTETRLGVVAWTVSGTGALAAAATSATITYTYNALGLVETRQEANGDLTSYVYDRAGRLIQTKGAVIVNNGGTAIRLQTNLYYDALGNVVRTVQDGDAVDDQAARITTSLYGAGGRLASTTDAAGFTRNFQYDSAGRVAKEWYERIRSDGSTLVREATGYRYDLAGRLVTQFGATWNAATGSWTAGDATRIAYNAYGEVVGKGLTGGPNDSAVHQEQFFYDAGGRMWKSTAGDGTVKLIYYDKAGNVSLTLSSAGADLSGYSAASAAATLTAAGGTTIANAVTTILVHDKRGLEVQSREPDRQLSLSGGTYTTAALVRSRTYNAFGELLSESDPRNGAWLTEYAYNAMGRMVEQKSPTVNWTSESGAVASARPTETYYYDLSGRLVGMRDAANRLTTRALEAGAGHDPGSGSGAGGGEALVHAEYHADGGQEVTWHNVFGDARVAVDALGQWEVRGYDNLGRVNEVIHRGNLISDYYAYDGLGRRIRHYNSQLGAAVVERTDYDLQGRVSQQIEMGGDTTAYAYAWSGTLATTGLGTFGGWTVTATHANGKTVVEQKDLFGRMLARTDMGGHAFAFAYDLGGRMTGQSVGANAMAYGWFNSGQAAWLADGSGNGAAYAYDAAGNRISEWTQKAWVTVQNATAAYDAAGRMTAWAELGNGTLTSGSPPASIAFEYDLVGNIRRQNASYRSLDKDGVANGAAFTKDQWFSFDTMNRVVSADGVIYGYDAAGRRVTATRTKVFTYTIQVGENGQYLTKTKNLLSTETYGYRADGAMSEVHIQTETFDPENGLGIQPGVNELRASYSHDAMGRLTHQVDWLGNGANAGYDRTVTYNNKGQISTDVAITKRGNDTYTAATTNQYGTGTGYALGAVTSSVTTNHKNTTQLQSTVTATNAYVWWDGAAQSSTALATDYVSGTDTTYTTSYAYSAMGQLASATIADGRPRTVTFVTDLTGQVIRRDEADNNTSGTTSGDPHEIFYRYGGRELGYTGNNGTRDTDYLTSIENRVMAPGTGSGAFFNNATSPTQYVDFDQSLQRVNSYSAAGAGGYTVRAGDTLQSIAMQLWGDQALWYKLAEANGLAAAGGLTEGQSLTIPPGILASGHSASAFKPYDAAKAMGDLSPNAAKPVKKGNNCGMVGQILMVAIAVGVTILTSGALASLGPVLAGAIGGAAGSVASQAFGVATGIQSKFDWKGVAMGAIGGAVGGAMGGGGIFGKAGAFGKMGAFAQGALRGAASSAITQGIGVATGLQDKFSWAGVASAGIIGGVSGAVTRGLTPNVAGATPSFAAVQAGSVAGAVAGAAARSLITGTSFGDNLIAVLPDVIGSTIGNMLAGGIKGFGRGETAESMKPEEALTLLAKQYNVAEMGGGGVSTFRPTDSTEQLVYDMALEQTGGDDEAARSYALAMHLRKLVREARDTAFLNRDVGGLNDLREIEITQRALDVQTFALDSYLPYGISELLPNGYRRLTASDYAGIGLSEIDLNDPRSGYFAAAYINDDRTELYIANRGTSKPNVRLHIAQSIQQGRGNETAIYNRAVETARRVRAGFSGNITFTGHSLGGGLASIQALVIENGHAVIFNAAGLHQNTLAQFNVTGINPEHRIYAVNTSLDPLTRAQDLGNAITDAPRSLPLIGPVADDIVFDSPRVRGIRVEVPSVYFNQIGQAHNYIEAPTPEMPPLFNTVERASNSLYYHSMISTMVSTVYILENDIHYGPVRPWGH